MKYADTSAGTYENDDSLEAIENHEEGFGLPGQSAVGHVGFVRRADIGNQDENSTGLTAPTGHFHTDLEKEPGIVSNEGLSSVSPGSLSPLINGALGSNMNSRIAYIMENGEPFCNHCEKNFVPNNLTRIACTNCGCGQPNDDHHLGENNFLAHVEGSTVKDEVGNKEIIKQESKMSFVETTLDTFQKKSNDSELYYRGYNDAQAGKPLDEDLALLSDDYYHGYDQFKFYNKTPQQSVGQTLYDVKPNSNEIPRQGQMTPGEADRGPLELTDGTNHATASKVLGLYEGFKTAEYIGTDVLRMSKEQRETGSVCKSPSGLSQAHIDTRGGSATCGLPATGRTDSGAPTCGGSNCGKKVKPLGTIKSAKISSIFPNDVIEKFFKV